LKLIFSALCLILSALPVFAQETAPRGEDLWVCPIAETAMYSPNDIAFGGGLALGYGNGIAFGVRVLFAFDADNHGLVESLLFLRLYLTGKSVNFGPFVQFYGGPVVFTYQGLETADRGIGTISIGASAGWRFRLGNLWFIEPAVRFGYPHIAGGGISAGLRR